MADTKISGLPGSTTPLAGTEVLPIVQSSSTVQVSVANLTAGRAVATGALTVTGALSATGNVTLGDASADTLNVGNGNLIKDASGNLGLGVTPNAWGSSWKAFQMRDGASLSTVNAINTVLLSENAYQDETNWRRIAAGYASQYQQYQDTHTFAHAVSSTANSIISWVTDATISSTALALGVGVSLTGGTSGTGFSFSGSAPATSLTLDASGNLLVGTTTANFNFSSGWNILLNSGAAYTSTAHQNGTASSSGYSVFVYNSGIIGSITQNGTTGVLYNLTSDYRLKNNPEALTGAKEFVMALQPKKWQWWDGSGEGVGFVAHEFMEVAKYSGHGTKDAVDTDGKPVMQSIQPSSSEVMANLVSLIQEQQALITQLTARITALETA